MRSLGEYSDVALFQEDVWPRRPVPQMNERSIGTSPKLGPRKATVMATYFISSYRPQLFKFSQTYPEPWIWQSLRRTKACCPTHMDICNHTDCRRSRAVTRVSCLWNSVTCSVEGMCLGSPIPIQTPPSAAEGTRSPQTDTCDLASRSTGRTVGPPQAEGAGAASRGETRSGRTQEWGHRRGASPGPVPAGCREAPRPGGQSLVRNSHAR